MLHIYVPILNGLTGVCLRIDMQFPNILYISPSLCVVLINESATKNENV